MTTTKSQQTKNGTLNDTETRAIVIHLVRTAVNKREFAPILNDVDDMLTSINAKSALRGVRGALQGIYPRGDETCEAFVEAIRSNEDLNSRSKVYGLSKLMNRSTIDEETRWIASGVLKGLNTDLIT